MHQLSTLRGETCFCLESITPEVNTNHSEESLRLLLLSGDSDASQAWQTPKGHFAMAGNYTPEPICLMQK